MSGAIETAKLPTARTPAATQIHFMLFMIHSSANWLVTRGEPNYHCGRARFLSRFDACGAVAGT
jgi:hypothetical protein